MIGIYKIVNTINNKIYIGSAKNIKKRWSAHKSDLNKNKHHSRYLQNAWNKYGKDSFIFEIVEELIDLSLLIDKEQYYINSLNPVYNCCPIAGNCLGRIHTEETKQKMRLRKVSEENKKKISEFMKNRPVKESTKQKAKERMMGNNYGKIQIYQMDMNENIIKEWSSASDAASFLNKRSSHITECCKNQRKSAFGYKWKYKN